MIKNKIKENNKSQTRLKIFKKIKRKLIFLVMIVGLKKMKMLYLKMIKK